MNTRLHLIPTLLVAGILCGSPALFADDYHSDPSPVRELVDRTQSDLRHAASLQHAKGDQDDRFRSAQKHLSTFDRHLTKGKFDKGELDDAIHQVKEVLDKNTLSADSRDQLQRDIEDLRIARERKGY